MQVVLNVGYSFFSVAYYRSTVLLATFVYAPVQCTDDTSLHKDDSQLQRFKSHASTWRS